MAGLLHMRNRFHIPGADEDKLHTLLKHTEACDGIFLMVMYLNGKPSMSS
jgi:hypothetical protein